MALWRIVKDGVNSDFDTQEEMNTYITDNSLVRGTYEIHYYMGSGYATANPGTDGWDQII